MEATMPIETAAEHDGEEKLLVSEHSLQHISYMLISS